MHAWKRDVAFFCSAVVQCTRVQPRIVPLGAGVTDASYLFFSPAYKNISYKKLLQLCAPYISVMKQKPVHEAMLPFMAGQMVLINKPLRWTSFDAVKKVRTLTGVLKVGHAGTLDPLATGLLIICTGKFTKKINEYMGMEKEYTGSITLGATTPTFDLETVPENIKPFDGITEEKLLAAAATFTGNIMQVPPIYSAIKKDGERLYDMARKGKEVIPEPRPVTINIFELTKIEMPVVYFRVVCTTGTYIRSLANDFGAVLGCGGHLSSLCRTKIGSFSVQDAYTPATFETYIQQLKQPSERQADA